MSRSCKVKHQRSFQQIYLVPYFFRRKIDRKLIEITIYLFITLRSYGIMKAIRLFDIMCLEGNVVPIRCNLSTLMGKNRYKIQDVCEKTGLARGTVSNLYHDKMQRIDYDTLEKLCKLFDCKANSILEFYLEDEE